MKRRRQGTGCLFFAGRTWWLRYYVNGERIAENSRLEDRAEAEALLKRRVAEAAGGLIVAAPGRATVADLCALVLADHELRGLRDVKTVRWRYEANVAPLLGAVPAAKLGSGHIHRYVKERRRQGAQDPTINRELSIVRRGYTLALREEPPLVARAPYIPKLEEDNVRQGFLEEEAYERLLEELPERLRALFVCGYYTGARLNELRRIEWSQVDFGARLIRLEQRQTKGKKARAIPVYSEMERWLVRQRESCPEANPFVFHGERNRPVGDHLRGWDEACERAGLAGLIFHDLRRSGVRNMKRAGVQDKVAMEISGHRTRAIFDRYNIVDEGDLGNAVDKVEEHFRQRKQARAAKLERVK